MRGLEFVAEHDRPRGLIIPGDAFQEHPGRRPADVPGRKPDNREGARHRRGRHPRQLRHLIERGHALLPRLTPVRISLPVERDYCVAIDSPNCLIVIDYISG